MKPVTAETPADIVEPPVPPMIEEAVIAEPPVAAQFDSAAPVEQAPEIHTPEPFSEPVAETVEEVQAVAAPDEDIDDVVEVQASETSAAPAAPAAVAASGYTAFDEPAYSNPDRSYSKKDDGYYVTVIQEKNAKQRNVLLLASLIFMVTLAFSGTVYSLFHKDLAIGAIDGGDLFAFVPVVEEVPMEVEEEKKKDDKDGGGGGGGGRDEKDPTSQGRLANQTRDPNFVHPDKSMVQKDFELKQPAFTQGDKTYPPSSQPYGNPNSRYTIPSNGQGSGGGQGEGFGQGQGSGRGTGNGSGDGSGSGSGDGDGNGNGSGSGSGNTPPPPPAPVGVTQKAKILFKPRATYTDAARTNNIQGNVTLRITFLANGQVGSISPVSGLPYGLTEQAISAARSIRFEPAKKNGVPYATTVTIQYGFAIY